MLIIFLILFLILSSLIPLLIDQVKEFVRIAPDVFNTVKGWANDIFSHFESNELLDTTKMKGEFFKTVENFASDLTTTMPKNFLGFISKLFSWFGTFVLGLIIGFFLIVNFDSSSKLFNFVPKKYKDTTTDLIDSVNVSLRSYVRGAILDCGLIFILSSIGLLFYYLRFW